MFQGARWTDKCAFVLLLEVGKQGFGQVQDRRVVESPFLVELYESLSIVFERKGRVRRTTHCRDPARRACQSPRLFGFPQR